MENYIERKEKYIKFEYDVFIKTTKLNISLFIHGMLEKHKRSQKIYIIQISKKRKVLFDLGRFVPSQMYQLINMCTWGQWALTDIYENKLNEYYDEAIKNIKQ